MSTTRKLRYTGERAQAFTEHGIGELQPGDEFTVPADQATRYTRRPDIEDARSGKGKNGDPGADSGAKDDGEA